MKLKDLIEFSGNLDDLADELERVGAEIAKVTESAQSLKEAVSFEDLPQGDLQALLDEVDRRFEAAKRGLGIANRLPAGPYRQKHLRQIMGNMNRIRAMLYRIQREIAAQATSSVAA